MSRRNSLENKRARREAKKQRKPLPSFINLIEYVKVRTHLSTRQAAVLILAGSLKADSHTLGFTTNKRKQKVLSPLIPAELRNRIIVVDPFHEPSE